MNGEHYDRLYPELKPDAGRRADLDGLPLYQVVRHTTHHCERSGYDVLACYLGVPVCPPRWWYETGRRLLAAPTFLMSRTSGNRRYNRDAAFRELYAGAHMLAHGPGLYHLIYGDSDLRYLKPLRRGQRLMATFHFPLQDNPSARHLRAFRERLAHALVMSQRQVPEFESVLGPGRVTRVPYGVDCSFFTPPVERAPSPCLRLVFIGVNGRDFQTLGRIVDRLSNDRKFELTLITDRRGAPLAAAPNIRWLQGLGTADYLRTLQQADALLLPLRMSTANSAVMEAMACGLPVLSNPGGVSDYVHDGCAVLWPEGDAGAALEILHQLQRSPDRVAAMGRAARAQALRHDWRNLVPRYEAAFRKGIRSAA